MEIQDHNTIRFCWEEITGPEAERLLTIGVGAQIELGSPMRASA